MLENKINYIKSGKEYNIIFTIMGALFEWKGQF